MAPTAALNHPNEDADEESIGTQLLADIEGIFSDRDVDRLASHRPLPNPGQDGRPPVARNGGILSP